MNALKYNLKSKPQARSFKKSEFMEKSSKLRR